MWLGLGVDLQPVRLSPRLLCQRFIEARSLISLIVVEAPRGIDIHHASRYRGHMKKVGQG
jgi:coenzyme F420-reducing hydrogenase alpha subunit